jgi:hypothetical protein
MAFTWQVGYFDVDAIGAWWCCGVVRLVNGHLQRVEMKAASSTIWSIFIAVLIR